MERNADLAFPVIKNVYETQREKYQRILVPFTDGVKTLNVATDLVKAYETEGKQLVKDFADSNHLPNFQKNTLRSSQFYKNQNTNSFDPVQNPEYK